MEFIRGPRRPFFLYLSHKAVHPELTSGPTAASSDPNGRKFIPADRGTERCTPAARSEAAQRDDRPPKASRLWSGKIGDLPPLGAATGTMTRSSATGCAC